MKKLLTLLLLASGLVHAVTPVNEAVMTGTNTQTVQGTKTFNNLTVTGTANLSAAKVVGLATVATTGSYGSLLGAPAALPALGGTSAYATVSGSASLSGTASYSGLSGTSAFSGLSGTASYAVNALNSGTAVYCVFANQSVYATSATTANFSFSSGTANYAVSLTGTVPAEQVSGLAPVAKSGSYASLIGKPTIPTDTNQLTNGAGYVTASGTVASITGTIPASQVSGIGSSGTANYAYLSGTALTISGTIPASQTAFVGNNGNVALTDTYNTGTAANGGNIFIGKNVGKSVSSGYGNTAIGDSSGMGLTTGQSNVTLGNQAGYSLTSGTFNTLIGTTAGHSITTGVENILVGHLAGVAVDTGSNNIVVGNVYLQGSAYRCTAIGNGVTFGGSANSYSTAIGAGASVSSTNTVVIGRSADKVSIPGSLNVSGTISGTIDPQQVTGTAATLAQIPTTLPATGGTAATISGSIPISQVTSLQTTLDGKASVRLIQTGDFTAAVNGRYTTSGTVTVTDPSGTQDGQIYSVVCGSGTVSIGGVSYAPSRIEIIRYYTGVAWSTLTPTLSDSLTLNGAVNTAPNQTLTGTSSLLTQGLGDARYLSATGPSRIICNTLASNSTPIYGSTTLTATGLSITIPVGTWLFEAGWSTCTQGGNYTPGGASSQLVVTSGSYTANGYPIATMGTGQNAYDGPGFISGASFSIGTMGFGGGPINSPNKNQSNWYRAFLVVTSPLTVQCKLAQYVASGTSTAQGVSLAAGSFMMATQAQ